MSPARLALIGAAALAALFGAGLLLEGAAAPAGCCGLTAPHPDPAQALRRLAAEDPRGLDAQAQRRAALAVLAARPADSNAWLRLAYADQLGTGRLSGEARQAVETSYLVLPYANGGTAWRLGFALDHWGQLSPQTRRDALREIGLARRDPPVWSAVRETAAKTRDPSGRVAAALLGLL